jgi:protein SCO1
MKLVRAHAAKLAALLLLVLTACTPAQKFNGELVEPAAQAPQLSGANWDGKPFNLSDQRGKVAVVFFGYTYCPDVCPFTLAKMKQLYARLGDKAEDVAVVFVSVDPQRDTVEKMARYVPNFDRRFYGLRLENVDETIKGFDAVVQFGQPKDGPETQSFYYVDHTGTFFVVDREGKLRLKFQPSATVDQMLPDIQKLLAT